VTGLALVEPLAGVGRHGLALGVAADRAGDHALQDHDATLFSAVPSGGDRLVTAPRPEPQPQPPTRTPQPPQPPPRTQTQTPTQTPTSPVQPPPVNTPPPRPVLPSSVELFFVFDRPTRAETGSAGLARSLRAPQEHEKLEAVKRQLQANRDLKVQLVGTASSEGPDRYNMDLGARRAQLIASMLGVDQSRFVDPPERDLRDECEMLRAGVWTCGEVEAKTPVDPNDRRVLVRFFI